MMQYIYIFLLCVAVYPLYAFNLFEAKHKIHAIDNHIANLQHDIDKSANTHSTITEHLASTEKEMSTTIITLKKLNHTIETNQKEITTLETQITHLQDHLNTQQMRLTQHIKACYMMGTANPLRWLLSEEDPQYTHRMIMFYQYIIRERQHIIDNIQDTQKEIQAKYATIKRILNEQQQAKIQLQHHKNVLDSDTAREMGLVQLLEKEIASKKNQILHFEHDKDTLAKLIASLQVEDHAEMKDSTPQSALPRFKGNIGHYPIAHPLAVHVLHPGLEFSAPEGTPVKAVGNGKVVFSDWLKGYGLLLIIDHGREYMSLYAHNQSLFKRKGDKVQKGEELATVGHTGGFRKDGLYFEIRRQGKPISVKNWVA